MNQKISLVSYRGQDGVVAWLGKPHYVTPWLDHGVHKNNKNINNLVF
ncbi:hypothetical protein [Rickettsia asembonensis]